MAIDKANMLCVLKILTEESDSEHILSCNEILDRMENFTGKRPDRRTVYSCIDELEEFGYEISDYEDNGKGYYLLTRTFSDAEIKLLIDAVYSCQYISKTQTSELLEKLRGFLSIYERSNFNYTNIIAPDKKSPNQEVFLNIEILEEAIKAKRQVSFTYLDYDINLKLVPRREKPYIVNPYNMICKDSRYYLVLIAQGKKDPSFYRIDMMKNIKILDTPLEISKREAKLDSVKNIVFAHTGKPRAIEIKFKKKILRYVIEDFGTDIRITDLGDGYLKALIYTSAEGFLVWALKYLQDAEVLTPPDIREKVIDAVKNNMYGIVEK